MSKIIIFDLDNTLVDTKMHREETHKKLTDEVNRMLMGKQSISTELIDEVFANNSKDKRFKVLAEQLFEGSKYKEAELRDFYMSITFDTYALYEHANEVLEFLSEKATLYLVSYGKIETQQKKIDITNIASYFKDIVIIETDSKKEVFQNIMAEEKKNNQKLTNKDYVIVGDSFTSDIIPAAEVGAFSILVGTEKVPSPSTIELGFHINSLRELLEILDL